MCHHCCLSAEIYHIVSDVWFDVLDDAGCCVRLVINKVYIWGVTLGCKKLIFGAAALTMTLCRIDLVFKRTIATTYLDDKLTALIS